MKAAAPKGGITPPPGHGINPKFSGLELGKGKPGNPKVGTVGIKGSDEHAIDIQTQIWGGGEASERGVSPRIPKVAGTMKITRSRNLPLWTTPSVISIGPYHYGKKPLEEGQKLKSRHAQKFIDESGQTQVYLYQKIRERTPEFREWYDHRAIDKLNDSQLATIFLLDGCFLLCFVINYSSKGGGFNNRLDLTNVEMTNIEQDLFLLENQLPYQVLRLLFEDVQVSTPSIEEKIKDFVASHAPFPRGIWANAVNPSPSHLLHYLHAILFDNPQGITPPQAQDKDDETLRGGGTYWRSCRTAQELMEVGIYFKPSATSFLTDISFEAHDFGTSACLKLPTISMKTSTMVTFLNLIAFESSDSTHNLGVISYLCLMDSLIDSGDDVKELQAAGILRNFVSEPKDVAQFFNVACSELVPSPYAYKDVRLQIESHVERHCDSRLRKWYVQFKQKYFSSPWSCIALTAAIIALTLTAIQTFTSLFPR